MRSVSSPPTVGSTTLSNSVVITSMPTTIARLEMPPSARGTMWPKLRLQPDSGAAGFSHRASATGNLTMPPGADAPLHGAANTDADLGMASPGLVENGHRPKPGSAL